MILDLIKVFWIFLDYLNVNCAEAAKNNNMENI